jgi:hypothetical protein
MADFNPAIPVAIKWSIGDNKYDSSGKNPKQVSLFIPLESIAPLAAYLNAIAEVPGKIRKSKVWNHTDGCEVEVEGIYLNGKGREGQYGDYGTINPAAVDADDFLPF